MDSGCTGGVVNGGTITLISLWVWIRHMVFLDSFFFFSNN